MNIKSKQNTLAMGVGEIQLAGCSPTADDHFWSENVQTMARTSSPANNLLLWFWYMMPHLFLYYVNHEN